MASLIQKREMSVRDMAAVLDQVNIYYSNTENISKEEDRLFDLTKKALDRFEEAFGIKEDDQYVGASNLEDWRKHITVMFERICADYNYNPQLIVSRTRRREVVDMRQNVAKGLYRYKFSFTKIGWLMKRDHTSIMHLVNVRK